MSQVLHYVDLVLKSLFLLGWQSIDLSSIHQDFFHSYDSTSCLVQALEDTPKGTLSNHLAPHPREGASLDCARCIILYRAGAHEGERIIYRRSQRDAGDCAIESKAALQSCPPAGPGTSACAWRRLRGERVGPICYEVPAAVHPDPQPLAHLETGAVAASNTDPAERTKAFRWRWWRCARLIFVHAERLQHRCHLAFLEEASLL
mmetsp:Transcript_13506/g.31782  ORF Transcript_13506/g.31782 Transcript_13506/m.31782 type:complete len:204 (-) Transcript_13506:61-672(-)